MHGRRLLPAALAAAFLVFPLAQAEAFCGFYVAKADTKLFNEASKVVLVRDRGRTVITMVNDYQGDPTAFAMVIPVPEVLERGQIHVTDNAVVAHLDAYTAPRLVEYFDPDPCRPQVVYEKFAATSSGLASERSDAASAKALGVTIEARYSVGEYDILILSAAQSTGLRTWLVESGYKLPEGVVPLLNSYIARGMKFFVARVNLAAQSKRGATFLRPLQIAFESEGFMLPIQLGMVNAAGPQELFVYTLTRSGRVETGNYRTVRMASDLEVPIFVREEFGAFYNALFDRQVAREGHRAVFTEYAWDMAWCDPCAADPLSVAELRELGVFWLDTAAADSPNQARDVFVTRLHVRYDAEHFPEDLAFRETGDRSNFQGRYVLRHPWSGPPQCRQARDYFAGLPARFEQEAAQLASLTGWPVREIRTKMKQNGQSFQPPGDGTNGGGKWWQHLWGDR